MLAGKAKLGKTLWIIHLLDALARGGDFCGLKVEKIGADKILYVSEEPQVMWFRRLQNDYCPLSPELRLLCLPFAGKPTLAEWERFVGWLAGYVADNGIWLVIFDTVANLGPAQDEQSNSEITRYMPALCQITAVGCTVLAIHHHGHAGTHAQAPVRCSALWT